ncbi:MAG: hypothetical protein PHV23_03850 [Candidatus Gracilibacteria bacterium]|nr:hypothetical protein [Candidatus Gracilibacteria bacterium]
MNLFINTVSKNSIIILFNDNREILEQISFEIKGNESSRLIPTIDEFLKKKELKYNEIKNIVLVNGPGSFTGVRTVVLAINSINYITNNNLTPISYFELFKNYPIVKSSSKRDCFFKENTDSKVEMILNEDIEKYLKEKNIREIYGEADIENVEIIENIDYLSIIQKIKLENIKKIDPLYIKKPNIC